MNRLKDYLSLFKLRIVALLVFVAVTAAVTSPGGSIDSLKIIILATSGGLASAGASILNNYFDTDIDSKMSRTKNRPLPKGRISSYRVFSLGVTMIFLAVIISTRLNLLTSAYILSGAVVYVVVYTMWLKRRTSYNIIIGGAAGSFAVLSGYAATEGKTSILALLVALLLFLWTPPHFWAFAIVKKTDYKRASIPFLPVTRGNGFTSRVILLHTILIVFLSIQLYDLGYFGGLYLLIAALFGVMFLISNSLLALRPTKSRAWSSYKFSGIYLVALFVAMLINSNPVAN